MTGVSPERSAIMRAVKGRDTAPEIVVRRLLRDLGYRYLLCRKDLPGCPDIAIRKIKKAIFVHGCFWHGHSCKRGGRVPKTNQDYWIRKVQGNKKRDRTALRDLRAMGWKGLVVWECELGNTVLVEKRLNNFLSAKRQ